MKKSVFALVIVLLPWSPVFGFAIFESFKPEDGLDPFTGYTPGWNVFTEYGTATAAKFPVAGGNYVLEAVTLSLGHIQDTSTMQVAVVADNAGLPTGPVLEVVAPNLAAVSNVQQVVGFESSLHPILAGGKAYWLVVTPPALNLSDGGDNSAYSWPASGVIGSVGIRNFDFDAGNWLAWNVFGGTGTQIPAFRIEGTLIPEPSALLLLALAASWIGCIRWQKPR